MLRTHRLISLKMLMLISLILLSAIATKAQEVSLPPTTITAGNTATTVPAQNGVSRILVREILPLLADCETLEDCQQKLTVANQRVNKILADLRSAIEAKDEAFAANEATKLVVTAQDKRIAKLLELVKDLATTNDGKIKKSIWKQIGGVLKEMFKHIADPDLIKTLVIIWAATQAKN